MGNADAVPTQSVKQRSWKSRSGMSSLRAMFMSRILMQESVARVSKLG